MKSKLCSFASLTVYQPVMANAVMASHKNLYGGFNSRHCTCMLKLFLMVGKKLIK